jgi:hypothetical protein
MDATPTDKALRRVVRLVALLNLSYFVDEFAVVLAIGSVSFFADSIDFLEDASVNFLILVALGWKGPETATCNPRGCACVTPSSFGTCGQSSPVDFVLIPRLHRFFRSARYLIYLIN